MSYAALRFDAEAEAAESWGDALLAAGALSVDMADPDAGTESERAIYGEPGASAGAWPLTRVTALFAHVAALQAATVASAHVMGRAFPPHTVFDVPEQDWVRATQAQFTPLRAADGLWIVPSWAAPVEPAAVNIVLDPGLAFGTGSHPTTRLCLAWLAQADLAGATVLDYGCGSGILAIAAARLGASAVTGTDIDPQALTASRDNARRNGVDARFVSPDALAAERFDITVANILANPLVMLAPALAQRVHPGGWIVLSGILIGQAAEVTAAYAPWFRIAAWGEEDGWVALVGQRLG